MLYYNTVTLKDGRTAILRNGTAEDGEADLAIFLRTHEQTDYLASYQDESTRTAEETGEYLKKQTESPDGIEILAFVDGKIAGAAGIEAHDHSSKIRHRADFGISVDRDFWGLGLGNALTDACIACARKAGFKQLELAVVSDNEKALNLYKKKGFVEYGRNPRAFLSRYTGYQELIYMYKVLEE